MLHIIINLKGGCQVAKKWIISKERVLAGDSEILNRFSLKYIIFPKYVNTIILRPGEFKAIRYKYISSIKTQPHGKAIYETPVSHKVNVLLKLSIISSPV